jgi:6-phosphogluconolactonase
MTHEAIEIAENDQSAANAAAGFILNELRTRLESHEQATLAISGGSTPKLMFQVLAKAPFAWNKVHIFWVDERCVPPDDDASNYKHANETLLTPAKIPAENIHRIRGEWAPEKAAAAYVDEIRTFFNLDERGLPAFDVIHRGMGADAHTASLFPGEPLIADETGIAAPVFVEKLNMHRVTLLPGVLRKARKTVMLVAGEDKAEALFQVLRGPQDPFRFPCQIATRDSENAIWFLDKAAAARL